MPSEGGLIPLDCLSEHGVWLGAREPIQVYTDIKMRGQVGVILSEDPIVAEVVYCNIFCMSKFLA